MKNQPLFGYQRGEVAEILFDALMVSMGYAVLRPTSMASVYDRVVDINNELLRFQIKSVNTDVSGKSWLKVKTSSTNTGSYKVADVDYIAIYISVLDSWYFQKNRGKSAVFVSFKNLNNFVECLGTKNSTP